MRKPDALCFSSALRMRFLIGRRLDSQYNVVHSTAWNVRTNYICFKFNGSTYISMPITGSIALLFTVLNADGPMFGDQLLLLVSPLIFVMVQSDI